LRSRTPPPSAAHSLRWSTSRASASSPWLVQLSQSGVAVVSGTTYAVSFAAKVGTARSIEAIVQQTASPYTTYASQTVSVTTTWQTYSFSFVSPSSGDASLRFNVAGATGTVWIDATAMTAEPSASPTPPPTQSTVSVAPTADADCQATSPNANRGSSTNLTSDGDPLTVTYLKFDLGAIAAGSITKAVLRMKVSNPSTGTHSVRLATSSSWTESTITYANRPSLGSALAGFHPGTSNAWIEVDLTAALQAKAGQTVTLGIDTTSADGFVFNARESSVDRPTLVVTAGSSTPSPTASPAPTPRPSASSSATPTPTSGPATKGVSLRPFAEYWGTNRAGMDADLAELNAAGVRWARFDLVYTSTPSAAFDAAVSAARTHGVNLLVTLRKGWPNKDVGTDTDRSKYRTWVAQMVGRYGYWVKDWEIQNEPNLHYEWIIDESPTSDQTQYAASVQHYLTVLMDAYTTIKATDSTARVVFAGLSEWTVERYMDVVVKTDAWRYFDVMAFHPYGWDPARVVSRFNSFKAKMQLNASYAVKPIWVDEVGFNTSWSNKSGYVSTEAQKADYLAKAMTGLHAAGAALPMFWYTLHENDASPGYGLISIDPATLRVTRYPAFDAYRQLTP
jgi:hypothetical protein